MATTTSRGLGDAPHEDQPAARAPGRRPSPGTVLAVLAAAGVAGALAAWQPLIGLALALVVLVAVLLGPISIRRLGLVAVGLAAVTAILGPNLAAPAAPGLFAFRILAILIALGLLAYLLMDGALVLPARVSRPAGLLGLMLLWSALSIGWSTDALAAIRWTTFLLMMVALAIGVAMVMADARRARRLLWALAGVWALACLIGAAEMATGLTLPTARDVSNAFGAASLFGNENNFAVYLALAVPWFLALPVVFTRTSLRVAGVAGAVVSIGFMLASGSKASLIALGLELIALLLLVGGSRRTRGRLMAAGLIAGLAVVIVVPSVLGIGLLPQRTVTKLDPRILVQQVEQDQGSGAVRTNLLSDGLDLVSETAGLGVGAGNAEVRVRGLAQFPGVANLHNWWLEVLVNLGLVGLAVYVAFYLLIWRGAVRVARAGREPLTRYVGIATTVSLAGWVIGSIGPSTAIHFAPMWITFGLTMGGLALLARERRREAA